MSFMAGERGAMGGETKGRKGGREGGKEGNREGGREGGREGVRDRTRTCHLPCEWSPPVPYLQLHIVPAPGEALVAAFLDLRADGLVC
jgi:hypothetical protein